MEDSWELQAPAFSSRINSTDTHWMWGLADSKAHLGAMEKKIVPAYAGNWIAIPTRWPSLTPMQNKPNQSVIFLHTFIFLNSSVCIYKALTLHGLYRWLFPIDSHSMEHGWLIDPLKSWICRPDGVNISSTQITLQFQWEYPLARTTRFIRFCRGVILF